MGKNVFPVSPCRSAHLGVRHWGNGASIRTWGHLRTRTPQHPEELRAMVAEADVDGDGRDDYIDLATIVALNTCEVHNGKW
ncbi:hypothetical protein Taro_021030 [Colocasia esculenta]|uniref:EF-hand domain-containing protein n=1 Tax=Colocasia esculenta TaxID=4460 RepID=A0A843VA97_COLES|nr:hypothetical protein [Colocasia esculenta]